MSAVLSPQQLQALLDTSHEGIGILDLDGRFLSLNTSGQHHMELSDRQQWQGIPLVSFWPGADLTPLAAAIDHARIGQSQQFTMQAPTSTGTPKWWTVTVSPVLDEDGQVASLSAAFRDVTAQTTAEADCQAALDQLEQQTERMQAKATALDAFACFMEAVGTEVDQRRLAQQAIDVVQAHVGGVSAAYYELDPDQRLWRSVAWSPDISPDVIAQMQAGVPLNAPDFAEVVRQEKPVFIEDWNAQRNTQILHLNR